MGYQFLIPIKDDLEAQRRLSFLSSPTLFLGHQFLIPIKDDLEAQRGLPFLSSTTLFLGHQFLIPIKDDLEAQRRLSFLSSTTLFLGHQFLIPIKDDLEAQRRLSFLSSTTLFLGHQLLSNHNSLRILHYPTSEPKFLSTLWQKIGPIFLPRKPLNEPYTRIQSKSISHSLWMPQDEHQHTPKSETTQ